MMVLFKLDLCEVIFLYIFNVRELFFAIVSAVENFCVQLYFEGRAAKIHNLFGTKKISMKLFLLKFTHIVLVADCKLSCPLCLES